VVTLPRITHVATGAAVHRADPPDVRIAQHHGDAIGRRN
jgi:hypothetical protein